MPSLILFRHAKSDWSSGSDNDLTRPLSGRGRRSARAMGRFLADAGQIPDLVLSSPAERALETIRIAMDAGGWKRAVAIREPLYGGVSELLQEIRGQAAGTGMLLFVGHEPTWSQTVEILIGGGSIRMPTGALARIELECASWGDVEPGCGQLSWLVHPRLFLAEPGGS